MLATDHKISILVRADIGRDTIDLIISGCLNTQTVDPLAVQVARARQVDPAAPVVVDLRSAQHVDPDALKLLRSMADAAKIQGFDGRLASVEFRLPATLEACSPAESPQALAT